VAMRLLWVKRSISMNGPLNEDGMPWVAYIIRILPRRDGPRLGFGREISLSSTGAPAIRLLLASRCPFIPAPERIWRRRIVELFVVLQCWAVEISRLLALPFEAYLGHIGPDDTVVR